MSKIPILYKEGSGINFKDIGDKEIQFPANAVKSMPEDYKILRDYLIENLSSKTEGLEIQRVNDYIKSLGLDLKKIIVLESTDLRKLNYQLTSLFQSLEIPEFEPQCLGRYLSEIDLVIIIRNRDFERLNGTIFTESLLVHELAHGSYNFGFYTPLIGDRIPTKPTDKHTFTRSGFNTLSTTEKNKIVSNRGNFLEEGFAEMLRANYVKSNMPEDFRKKIMNKLGHEESSPINKAATKNFKLDDFNYEYKMPIQYAYFQPDGKLIHAASAPAGIAFELLCKKNPRLYPALIEARSSPEGLRRVAKILDVIKPGLYSKLTKLQYNDKDFTQGLKYIIDTLYNGQVNMDELA